MTTKNGKEINLMDFVRDIARIAILGISGWIALQFVEIRDNSKLLQERYTNIKIQQDLLNLKLNELTYNNMQLTQDVEDSRELIELLAVSVGIRIPKKKEYRERK